MFCISISKLVTECFINHHITIIINEIVTKLAAKLMGIPCKLLITWRLSYHVDILNCQFGLGKLTVRAR